MTLCRSTVHDTLRTQTTWGARGGGFLPWGAFCPAAAGFALCCSIRAYSQGFVLHASARTSCPHTKGAPITQMCLFCTHSDSPLSLKAEQRCYLMAHTLAQRVQGKALHTKGTACATATHSAITPSKQPDLFPARITVMYKGTAQQRATRPYPGRMSCPPAAS